MRSVIATTLSKLTNVNDLHVFNMLALSVPVDAPPSFNLHLYLVSPIVSETVKAVEYCKAHSNTNDMHDSFCALAVKLMEGVEKHDLETSKWF